MLSLLLTTLFAADAAAAWLTSWERAEKAARAAESPILVDFQAVWCYSCYYMDENVLETPEFAAAAEGLVRLKLDVDTAEGRRLRDKYRAGHLPSYLLLSPDGTELGRIVGERTRAEFLRLLGEARGKPRDDAARRLAALLDAGDLDAAQAFRDRALAADASAAQRRDWRLLSRRLDLRRAAALKNDAAGGAAFVDLLELEGGCELAWDAYRAGALIERLPPARRAALAAAARRALMRLAESKVFNPDGEGCADARSVVETAAEMMRIEGDAAARRALLKRAVSVWRERQREAGLGASRNVDDDLRYFLTAAEHWDDLDALYPRLIAAYPADYVYAYRWGRSLLGRERAAEAVPLLEKAYHLSYGKNRLSAAGAYAEALAAVGRAAEARVVLRREIKSGARRFPDALGGLRAQLEKLPG